MISGEYTSKLTLNGEDIIVKNAHFHDTKGCIYISKCTNFNVDHSFFDYSYNDYAILVAQSNDNYMTYCCLYNCTLEYNNFAYGKILRLYATNQSLVTDLSYTFCYEEPAGNKEGFIIYQNCKHAFTERHNNSFNTFSGATGPLITASKSVSWKYVIAYESLTRLLACEFYLCGADLSASKLVFYKCDTTSADYPLFFINSNYQFTVSDSIFAWNRNICPFSKQITSIGNYFTDSKDVVLKFGAKLGSGNSFWGSDAANLIAAIEVELPLGQFKCAGKHRGEQQNEMKTNFGNFHTILVFSMLLGR